MQKTIHHRQHISAIYRNNLPRNKQIEENAKGISIYIRYPVEFGNQKISSELHRLGIRRMYPFSITREPSIKPFIADENDDTPGANMVARNLATLPTHHNVDDRLSYKIARLTRMYLN